MKAQAKTWKWQTTGMATRLLILAAVMLVVGALTISAAVHFQVVELEAAVLALIVCVISSQLAHIVGEYPSGDDYFMARLAASISVRTGIPLFAVVFVKLSPKIPFEPAFVFFIVLFYLVGLFVDVALHVLRLKPVE